MVPPYSTAKAAFVHVPPGTHYAEAFPTEFILRFGEEAYEEAMDEIELKRLEQEWGDEGES